MRSSSNRERPFRRQCRWCLQLLATSALEGALPFHLEMELVPPKLVPPQACPSPSLSLPCCPAAGFDVRTSDGSTAPAAPAAQVRGTTKVSVWTYGKP